MGSCRHMAVGRRDGNRISSSYYSLTIPFIMHSPNAGSEGHLIVALTLLGGTKRNRHPRPTLRWAACTSASGAEDLGIWLRSVPLHSGLNVLAIAVVSMATATTTASPTSTPHTLMLSKVISYPSGFSRRGSRKMPCPRQQQQQQPIVNGTMPWPQLQPQQQQQQQQPQQQLISYDGDGGWVRGSINGGAGVLPPSGNGGDGGRQQWYTRGHGSVDGSGGGNISGGNGDDGYTLVAGGSGPTPNWAVEKRQDGDYTEDDSGPFVGPFGTSQDFSAKESIIFPTLGPELHVLARSKQQHRPPPHSMGAGVGAGAVGYQRARPQQRQRPPPHLMGAGVGTGAVENQRARPQQRQRPPPHSMGAGVGAGEVENQRARPQQQQRPPPHSMGAGIGDGAVEHQRARPQQQQRPPPHSMGAGVGAGAVEHQRAQSQQQQRPPPHSMGAVVLAVTEKTQHQRQSPQQELEPSVVTDGAGAANSATDQLIPAAERSTGDETISGGGSGAGTVTASSTRGQQDHLVVRSPSPRPVPCDTGGYEIEIEIKKTATGSVKDVYASCGGGGYRADSRPAGRSLLLLGEARSGPRTPVRDTGDVCTSARGAVRPHLGKGGAQGDGGALGGRDLRGGRGNVANGEFRPLQREAFCVHRNFVMNIP